MALKVIGAGHGRSGTTSLRAALERLGYVKCHHMDAVYADPQQSRYWLDIAEGRRHDWDEVYDGFLAAIDGPNWPYALELAERYPDAKVIYTERDFDSWYESARATIYAIRAAWPRWYLAVRPHLARTARMHDVLMWDGIFGGRFEDKEAARAVYDGWRDTVLSAIPPDRLLVMRISEGWEPLCAFLGHDVPSDPFPHVNDRDAFRKMIFRLTALQAVPFLAGALVLLLLFAAL